MRIILGSILLLFIFAFPVSSTAQIFPATPSGHVNDLADFMSRAQQNSLEQKLRAYRDSTSNVIAILTLNSLQGESVEYIAEQTFNTWRMWEGERQNGILILVSRQDRSMRIEVGYGLEGAVPDILAGRVVNEVLIPGFRQEQYFEAFNRSTDILMQLAAGEYDAIPQKKDVGFDGAENALILFLFLFLIFVLLLSRGRGGPGGGHHIRRGSVIVLGSPGFGRRGYGGGFSGGGFGGGGFGGFGGGGGFGSGGGGASGRW
jgi:uncharacterized protein